MEQARDGTHVTPATVTEWLTAFRDPSRREIKLRLVHPDEPAPAPENPEPFAAENWRILTDLLDTYSAVHISTLIDNENGERTVHISLIGSKRASYTAATLETALTAVAGVKRENRCKGPCGEVKPLEQFSRLKCGKDGRNKYCLVCERARVKNYLARKSQNAKTLHTTESIA